MNEFLDYSPAIKTNCPNLANHTKMPEEYTYWDEWMEAMAPTHELTRCPECRRWEIWVPKGGAK